MRESLVIMLCNFVEIGKVTEVQFTACVKGRKNYDKKFTEKKITLQLRPLPDITSGLSCRSDG